MVLFFSEDTAYVGEMGECNQVDSLAEHFLLGNNVMRTLFVLIASIDKFLQPK